MSKKAKARVVIGRSREGSRDRAIHLDGSVVGFCHKVKNALSPGFFWVVDLRNGSRFSAYDLAEVRETIPGIIDRTGI